MDLRNKVAIVTGGGTGIGRATSIALAERGVLLAVNYSRSKTDADETVDWINSNGGRAVAIQADVSQDKEIREMVDRIVRCIQSRRSCSD